MPKGRRTCLRILFCVGVAGLVMWTTGGPRVLTPAPPALSQAETETLLTGLQHNLDQVETLQGAFTVRCEPGDAPWLTEEKERLKPLSKVQKESTSMCP